MRPIRITDIQNEHQLRAFLAQKKELKTERAKMQTGDFFDMGTLKSTVKSFYDLQSLRIAMGNRIAAQFNAKVRGVQPGEAHDDELTDSDVKKILDLVRTDYALLTKGYASKLPTIKTFKGEGLISAFGEYVLVNQFMEMHAQEGAQKVKIESLVEMHPLYIEFSSKVYGFGKLGTAVLLASIDISQAQYVSSLWKYAGLDVNENGEGRNMSKKHQVSVPYFDEEDKFKWKSAITFNKWLRARLLGGFAPSLIKCGGEYKQIYDGYKHRLQNSQKPRWQNASKGHIHKAAVRYMMKILLLNLYPVWRKIEGLPVSPPYHEAKLHMTHGGG
jgi:hypothetical protein